MDPTYDARCPFCRDGVLHTQSIHDGQIWAAVGQRQDADPPPAIVTTKPVKAAKRRRWTVVATYDDNHQPYVSYKLQPTAQAATEATEAEVAAREIGLTITIVAVFRGWHRDEWVMGTP